MDDEVHVVLEGPAEEVARAFEAAEQLHRFDIGPRPPAGILGLPGGKSARLVVPSAEGTSATDFAAFAATRPEEAARLLGTLHRAGVLARGMGVAGRRVAVRDWFAVERPDPVRDGDLAADLAGVLGSVPADARTGFLAVHAAAVAPHVERHLAALRGRG